MKENFEYLKKYNFWSKTTPNLGFIRHDYLNKFKPFLNNSLIKVLVGQRRTGKSYLLRQIIHHLIESGVPAKNTLYINKEYLDFDGIENYTDLDRCIQLYKNSMKPKGKVYVFIDEVQYIQQWERLVNSYAQDYTSDYELFITGSNSKMLSGELAGFLSGRYIQFEIFPFSYAEFIARLQLPAEKSSYLQYLQEGGLPEMMHLPNQETKRQYISALKDTIMLRDIVQRYAIKEPKLLNDLWVYIIQTQANLMSVNNITHFIKSRGRKVNYDTVANYLGYLEEAFLIHKTERYNIKGKDLIGGNVKYYANDVAYGQFLFSGFRHGLGYVLESLVYLELRRNGYTVYAGVLPNKEIDFVAIKAERIIYLQCAYILVDEATINREFSALEAIRDAHGKYVVSLDEIPIQHPGGIKHIQAWNLHTML